MRIELENKQSGDFFSIQLLDIDNGKIPVDSSSGYIIFPTNFCHFTETKTKLIEKVFPNIAQNLKKIIYGWSKELYWLQKNDDVNEMNFQIQNKIAGELITYKSIDSVTNQGDVRYPTEFLNSLELPG
jgi:PIF1 helicase.